LNAGQFGTYAAYQPENGSVALAERLSGTDISALPHGQNSNTYAADLVDGAEGLLVPPLVPYDDVPARRYDVWTEVHGAHSSTDEIESDYWIAYLGAHYFVSPDFILGGLVQFDWTDEEDNEAGTSADGFGWMAGPYLAGRIAETSIAYEARAAWGRSDNDVSPFGTYTDDFETERWLLSGKVQGSFNIDTLTITPSVRVSYFEETQESYTDSLTNKIPEQTVSLGEVKFGPEFSQTFVLDDGSIFTPNFGVFGVWNFDIEENDTSEPVPLGDDDLRARLDAGLSFTNTMGWIFSASGYYDGVGVDDYNAFGGKLRLSIPLE
jgi:outer membrane autotransporter protein